MLGVNSANSGVMDPVEVVEQLEVVTSTAEVGVVEQEVVVAAAEGDDRMQKSEVEASSD